MKYVASILKLLGGLVSIYGIYMIVDPWIFAKDTSDYCFGCSIELIFGIIALGAGILLYIIGKIIDSHRKKNS
jgi:hypothetical protein